MGTISKARFAFIENSKDVDRLLDIHKEIAGDSPGKKVGVEVLNKSAIVLITAIWEAFCEDLLEAAIENIANFTSDTKKLPKELRKTIKKKIDQDKDELACWNLAQDGWRKEIKNNFSVLRDKLTVGFNNPSAKNIEELFEKGIGLDNLTKNWSWTHMTVTQAVTKLDQYVLLRHKIAHRGAVPGASVKKSHVISFLGHVSTLVGKIESRVEAHVISICGHSLLVEATP